MGNFVLVAVVASLPSPDVAAEPRRFFLESMDGSAAIALRHPDDPSLPWGLRTDATGLGLAPTDVDYTPVPGGRGALPGQVIERERPVVLPLVLRSVYEHATAYQYGAELADMVSPSVHPEGFRLVCATHTGTRWLGLHYNSGLEGHQVTHPFVEHVVLDCTATDPIAYDRERRDLSFRLAADDAPFLGGTWGEVALAGSAIRGGVAIVQMGSAVPVWPTMTLRGPVDEVLITSDAGLRIEVPAALTGSDELVVVTDPRARSIRLNGSSAAGRLARGTRLVPLPVGTSTIEVSAPGATADSLLRLSYLGGWRSLW